MLTVDILRLSPVLSGLTDEQLGAIAEMSKNDEGTVIGAKVGEVHNMYASDIHAITGFKQKDGESGNEFSKRVLTDFKSRVDKAKSLNEQLTTANGRIQELQSKLEAGGGEETVKALRDARVTIEQLRGQVKAKDEELTANKAQFDKDLTDVHLDYAFKDAFSGLKFKEGITEPLQKTLIDAAKSEVLRRGNPEFITNGGGARVLVLRGGDGNIINNPGNNLNPYTVRELVMETSIKDALDFGTTRTGTGGNGGGTGGNGGGNTFSLLGVKSQLEADAAIESYLLSNGYTRDSHEFAVESMKLRNENKVSELPIK
jgi:hypothetical protein